MTFDEWLITQNTPEWAITYREIMRKAWEAATTAERDRCEKECDGISNDDSATYKDYEDTYLNGWLDACNECRWSIHGIKKSLNDFTQPGGPDPVAQQDRRLPAG